MHVNGSETLPVPSSVYSSSGAKPAELPVKQLLQSYYDLRYGQKSRLVAELLS